MEKPKSGEEMMKIIKAHENVFQPDEEAQYSNTNYVLLTYIIEKIEEDSFSNVLDYRITRPLALENTYYGGKIQPSNNEAFFYKAQTPWELTSQTDISIPGGAGAIVSNPSDLNKFLHALFSGQVVSENAFQEMTSIVDNFGTGLVKIPYYDKIALGHNGGIDGFLSSAAYFPED